MNKSRILEYYEQIIAVLWVVIFYTYIDIYNFMTNIWPLTPKHFVLLLGIASLPIIYNVVKQEKNKVINLFTVCTFAVSALFLVSLFFNYRAENLELFRMQALSMAFLFVLYFLFINNNCRKSAQYAILACLIFATLINLAEVVHPLFTERGRSAGLYNNPNISAVVLTMGLILTISLIPSRLRIPAIILVGGAVLGTLSRGGLITFIGSLVLLAYQGFIKIKFMKKDYLANSVLVFILILLFAWGYHVNIAFKFNIEHQLGSITSVLSYASKDFAFSEVDNDASIKQVASQDVQQLITQTMTDPQYVNNSGRTRVMLLGYSWAIYKANLWLGIGMDRAWALSPHNEYLLLALAYGLMGWIILPIFAVIIMLSGDKRISIIIGTVWLLAAITSHNVMVDRAMLLSLALVATYKPKQCPKQAINTIPEDKK